MEILGRLHNHLPAPYHRRFDIQLDDAEKILSHPHLFIGQTCGYPYVYKWQPTHDVVCVAEFAVKGCHAGQYSSWIIAHADSAKSDLAEFTGSTAAINNINSNSGMNVFRYAVSKHANSPSFFKNVLVSGSHILSMNLVAAGKADIAAIDAATYHFAIQQGVIDAHDLKIIGQTRYTTGLPFIVAKTLDIDRRIIIDGLNASLDSISAANGALLNISGFRPVQAADYGCIRELALKARQNGYPQLK